MVKEKKINIFGIVISSVISVFLLLLMVSINIISYRPVGNASLNVVTEHQLANNSLDYNINFASNLFNPTLSNFTYDVIPTRYISTSSNATITFNIGNTYGNNFIVGMKKVGGGNDDSYGFYVIDHNGIERRFSFNSINNYEITIQYGFRYVSFWSNVIGYYDFELYSSNVNSIINNVYNNGIDKGKNDALAMNNPFYNTTLNIYDSDNILLGSSVYNDVESVSGMSFDYNSIYPYSNDKVYLYYSLSSPLDYYSTALLFGYEYFPQSIKCYIYDERGNETFYQVFNPTTNIDIYSVGIVVPNSTSSRFINGFKLELDNYNADSVPRFIGVDYSTTAYNNGYNIGFDNGINEVVSNPNDYDLYDETQYNESFSNGRAEGLQESDLATSGFKTIVNTILNSPYNILYGMFNWSILGINLFSLIAFLVSCGIIAFIIGLLRKK